MRTSRSKLEAYNKRVAEWGQARTPPRLGSSATRGKMEGPVEGWAYLAILQPALQRRIIAIGKKLHLESA